MTALQKLSENVKDLGKLIVAKCIKKLPKVQYIAQSGHTGPKIKFSSKCECINSQNKCVKAQFRNVQTSTGQTLNCYWNQIKS